MVPDYLVNPIQKAAIELNNYYRRTARHANTLKCSPLALLQLKGHLQDSNSLGRYVPAHDGCPGCNEFIGAKLVIDPHTVDYCASFVEEK
jgi:hypothetical protein